jgi:hypothetical protein
MDRAWPFVIVRMGPARWQPLHPVRTTAQKVKRPAF